MCKKVLAGIAGHNEAEGLSKILPEFNDSVDILVIDDGSVDQTKEVAKQYGCFLVSHKTKMGYGKCRKEMLQFAVDNGYEAVITMDGDGQHCPRLIPIFVTTLQSANGLVVRASRYHPESIGNHIPPEWLELNKMVTNRINEITGWNLTDALCGMMGLPVYMVKEILPNLHYDCYGYAIEILLRLHFLFPTLKIQEIPHPAIYSGTHKLDFMYSAPDLSARKQRFYEHLAHIDTIQFLIKDK